MIYGFSAIALATSIFCIFLFTDFKKNRKFLFADIFMNDFEISRKRIIFNYEFADELISDFEERWKGHIAKRTLNLYIGKLIETQYLQQIKQL